MTDRPTTDLRAYSHILGKLQTAITLQRVNRSPSCLVLGWGFQGRRIQRHHFWFDQIQDGGRRPFWKTSNGHISAMRHPVDVVFGSGLGFLGTVDRKAPFPVGSNPRWRPAAILENFKWPYLSNVLSDSLYVCMRTILCPRSLIYNDGDSKLIS